jgi:hypothetical protein
MCGLSYGAKAYVIPACSERAQLRRKMDVVQITCTDFEDQSRQKLDSANGGDTFRASRSLIVTQVAARAFSVRVFAQTAMPIIKQESRIY